ncbi:hypothetical protein ECB98_07525 [Brucellaceae bacterium VT-16-1752]|nr:hypothetical protein ECB98_07525 [Brucellaceae bacterium VT-16-1752]
MFVRITRKLLGTYLTKSFFQRMFVIFQSRDGQCEVRQIDAGLSAFRRLVRYNLRRDQIENGLLTFLPVHPVRNEPDTTGQIIAAIGSVIANVPPDCTNVVINGISYKDCNGNWFEPKYNGHSVVYVAVAPPK